MYNIIIDITNHTHTKKIILSLSCKKVICYNMSCKSVQQFIVADKHRSSYVRLRLELGILSFDGERELLHFGVVTMFFWLLIFLLICDEQPFMYVQAVLYSYSNHA